MLFDLFRISLCELQFNQRTMPIKPRSLPPQEIVAAYLSYDPVTGIVTKNTLGREYFNTDRGHKIHLARDAGKIVGSINAHGYLFAMIAGTVYPLHRLIWVLVNGSIDEGKYIDHKNGIRSDNRWQNLDCVEWADNQRNSGIRKDNTSGFKGVRMVASGKYVARVKPRDQGQKHLGTFDTPEEAYAAVMNYNVSNFGDRARTGPTTVRRNNP